MMIAVLALALLQPAVETDAPARVWRDVPYLPADAVVDARRQSLDIHAPRGAQAAPVLIYVHGGGWTGGDKANVHAKASFFNARGFVLVSVNYRLLPAGAHPNNVRDVAAAVAWARRSIDQYGGDPNRLLLMGHSAGAHLSALAAADPQHFAVEGEGAPMLRALIVNDTAALDVPALMGRTRSAMYRDAFGEDAARWAEQAPITFAASGAVPPTLLICSGEGGFKSDAMERFAAAVRAAGGRAEVLHAPDKTHGSVNADLGKPDDPLTVAVARFIDEALAGPTTRGADRP